MHYGYNRCHYFLHFIILCATLLGLSSLFPAQADTTIQTDLKVIQVSGNYAQLREELELAITERGLVISKVLRIADMLQRTADSMGGKPLYDKGESLLFCSAALSYQMMIVNPDYIALCPFKITIYTVAATPGVVYLSYPVNTAPHHEKTQQALHAINQLLAEIVQAVVTVAKG